MDTCTVFDLEWLYLIITGFVVSLTAESFYIDVERGYDGKGIIGMILFWSIILLLWVTKFIIRLINTLYECFKNALINQLQK